MNGLVVACIVVAVVSALVGAVVCHEKRASGAGFMLGLLFGPIGILIAVLAVDNREPCNNCGGRFSGMPNNCPHCNVEFVFDTPRISG